jgi:tetratricopeptide (TPR) repeat protein
LSQRDPHDATSRARMAENSAELGKILAHTDPARALGVYEKGLARVRETQNSNLARRLEAALDTSSAYPLMQLHRNEEARRKIDDALELLRAAKIYPADQIVPGSEADDVLRARGDYLAATGKPVQAAAVYEELLAKISANKPDTENALDLATLVSSIYQSLETLDRTIGRSDRATELEARRLEIWRHWDRKLPGNTFVQRHLATTPR